MSYKFKIYLYVSIYSLVSTIIHKLFLHPLSWMEQRLSSLCTNLLDNHLSLFVSERPLCYSVRKWKEVQYQCHVAQ
jgi:hypothetical protein